MIAIFRGVLIFGIVVEVLGDGKRGKQNKLIIQPVESTEVDFGSEVRHFPIWERSLDYKRTLCAATFVSMEGMGWYTQFKPGEPDLTT